ncbi:MAG TPA: hypothetical protein PK113_01575 [Bacillota bacterium]|nr:hypothetical protein [Bacillota bacterium]
MMDINYNEVREELRRKNLLEIQKELTEQRRNRTAIMSFLLFALIFTVAYGMLENPFIYTLSNIGNFFTYRLYFIIWAIICGVSIEFALPALFNLEAYQKKYARLFVYLSVLFLIATSIIPALKDDYPVLHLIHTITSGLYALFLYLALVPFTRWISKENPRLRIYMTVWQIVIWIGSILLVIIFWHSALFELWFFITNIIFLIYLSLVLYEEKIVKISIRLMSDEENLNLAIEKIFVNLDEKKRRKE